METILRKIMPPPFEVRSPRRKLTHFYFAVEGKQVQNKLLYLNELKGESSGEVRANNYYLVAPGSTIKYRDLETGEEKIGTYTVTQDRPIAVIHYNDFMKAITPFLGKISSQKLTLEQMKKGVSKGERNTTGFKYACFLVRTHKFDRATAVQEMQRWNNLCTPPMDNSELERMVNNALEYKNADDQKREISTIINEENKKISEDVSDVFGYSGDQEFKGRIQIKSVGNPQSRYSKLTFTCYREESDRCAKCGFQNFTLNFKKKFDASAFATYFDTNIPKIALTILKEKDIITTGCKKIQAKGENELSITQTIVSDRIGNEAKAWFIHSDKCDLRKRPNWILAKGWLCRGLKGRIGVLVQKFVTESEVMKPDEDAIIEAKLYLKKITTEDKPTIKKIADTFQRKSNLKGEEITRGFEADFLTIASPIWVKTPEGPRNLSMTSSEIGKTTTAKSQRVREVIEWLKAGKYGSGKMTTAGIAAGSEKIEGMGWVTKKGLLPSFDLSFVILDNMFSKALDAFVESRRNGVIMVNSIQGDTELWARTRLKLLANPKISVDSHVQKCTTLKMHSKKWIARLTFAIFTYGVPTKDRYDSTITELTEEDELLLKCTKNVLLWNLSLERTYTVQKEHWSKIMILSEQLENKFRNEEIPLLLRSIPHKIATLASCFALFEGEDDPLERHIQQAYQWLYDCAVDIQLDEYTALYKEENTLEEEEYLILEKTVNDGVKSDMHSGGSIKETVTYGFLEKIAKKSPIPLEEMAASLGVSEPTIKRRSKTMKGLGITKSSKDGYFFTVKGVKFWKNWIKTIKVIVVKPEKKSGDGDPDDTYDLDLNDHIGKKVENNLLDYTKNTTKEEKNSIMSVKSGINEIIGIIGNGEKQDSKKDQEQTSVLGVQNNIITSDKVDSGDLSGENSPEVDEDDSLSLLDHGELVAYVERTNKAFPCNDKCGLAAEWKVQNDGKTYYFCNNCFQKTRMNLEINDYKVRFKEESS